MENWKPIPGYEGYYEASDMGRVRSVARVVASSTRNGGARLRPSKVLRLKRKRNGYLAVQLSKEGEVKDQLVHRLIASTFLGDRTADGLVVNHRNLNKADNRVVNLEWCTTSENNRHSRANQEYKPTPLRKRIRCVEKNLVFDSSYQAAMWVNETERQFSGNVASMSRSIRACATGVTRSAYGYRWRDVVDEPSTTILKGSTPKRVEMGDPS